MILEDIERLQADMMAEVVKRRQLGGYSADAGAILMLAETNLRILDHLREQSVLANREKKDGRTKG